MKKIAFLFAALLVSAGAIAQPGPGPAPHGPGVDQRHDRPSGRPMRNDHKRKVWVPTHRDHGRLVKGHYVWR